LQFRPDIQGLRGIAVLGVFLYHLGINGVSGGYVGVDIFFVISGFLITSIVAQDIRANRFSFAQFYNRRMKRILPAFQLVGLATLLAGWLLFLPTSLLVLIKSQIASSLFVSNIYFWRETTGYFGSESDELPLLHNWSLSVEEQFYLLWPLTLVLLFRFTNNRRVSLTICAAVVGTFLLAQWGAGFKATAAYFLLPTRAGEFLLGALLVFLPESRRPLTPIVAQSLGAIGLVLVVAPNVMLNEYSRFPGFNAFWPCLGTALVIDSGRRTATFVKSLLTFRPLVFVGTISYSLYLWHWPPVAFLHYFDIELSGWQKFALFCSVLLAAWLSWRYVEESMRRLNWRLSRTVLVLMAPLLLVQFGALLHAQSQKPAFPGLAEFPLPDECLELSGINYPVACRLGDQQKVPSFILWGDSFAGSLWMAIDAAAKRDHVSGYQFTKSLCPSITGVVWDDLRLVPNPEFPQACSDFATHTLNFVLQEPAVQTVVLTSNYFWYLTAKNLTGGPILAATHTGANMVGEFQEMLERLAAADKRIIVVMPHPSDKQLFHRALRRAFVLGTTAALATPAPPAEPDALSAMIESLSLRISVDRIYPHLLMCDADKCRVFDADGDLYLSDGAHVTAKMARAILARFPQDWHRRPGDASAAARVSGQ
jgi:peptidoglycan/LPS O-acetylase OafA/YrhL